MSDELIAALKAFIGEEVQEILKEEGLKEQEAPPPSPSAGKGKDTKGKGKAEEEITKDMINALGKRLQTEKGADAVKAVLKTLKVASVKDVKEKDYPKFHAELTKAIGAEDADTDDELFGND